MYPDCAEQILRVYEADPDGQVVGVMADEAAVPPGEAPAALGGPAAPAATPGKLRRLKDRLLQALGVMAYLLPYDARAASRPWPKGCDGLRVLPRETLYGAWMTFRRWAVEAEPFEEILDAYAYLEDADASYRAARHGLLLLAQDARLCHLRAPGGRLSDYTLSTLGALNALVLHRLHSDDLRRSRSLYRSFLLKQFAVQALRDLGKRDGTFPRARGILTAMGLFRTVFGSSEEAVRVWYPRFQAELLARDPCGHYVISAAF
jgi:hypothetical protein